MSMGKCSSVASHASCATTACLAVVGAPGLSGGSASGTSSMITFQVPGFPVPATVLKQPGGGWFKGASLKSNLCSAAISGPANATKASQRMYLCMSAEHSKKHPGDKHLPQLARDSAPALGIIYLTNAFSLLVFTHETEAT